MQERLPIEPALIEVLGSRVKATDVLWTALDWSRAVQRTRTKIAMPWRHPEDPNDPDFEGIYAVYPRAEPGKRWRGKMVKDVWFERDGDKWFVVHAYQQSTNKEG